MGVYEGRGNLTKSMKELLQRWNDTKLAWDDAQSRAFEEKFLSPLEQDLKVAVAAMDHVGILLSSARRECQ